MVTKIQKRDGRVVDFEIRKISSAILGAVKAVHEEDFEDYTERVMKYTSEIRWLINKEFSEGIPTVEQVQDIVEKTLVKHKEYDIAKEYILYRDKRNRARAMDSGLMVTISNIFKSSADELDLKRDNANIDGETAMGTMLQIGSETSKSFYLADMITPKFSDAHKDGDIHIHDLDFYGLTETCCQIDLTKLFNNGFSTGHGFIREPSNILSAAALTCIAIQSNQNDQHGGQSIAKYDFDLAPYVAKTFIKWVLKVLDIFGTDGIDYKSAIEPELEKIYNDKGTILSSDSIDLVKASLDGYFIQSDIERIVEKALFYTNKETYQANEALVHNLNSMHSRAGAQVPFSSINLGTNTSEEGRMIIKNFLLATESGLGFGETPIFPISVFKVKEGVNYLPGDPNYDLFKLACRVSAKRLFPNFSFLDATFNLKFYKEGRPETECTYMGCRTRVLQNVYDPDRSIVTGRGNLSFTTINLPRIAILSNEDQDCFFKLLREKVDLVFDQMYERYTVQSKKKVRNYPFLMGQGIWLDSEKLGPNDKIKEILKHGTLSAGFIGLAECLVALIGKHQGESLEAQELGLKIVSFMRDMADKKSQEMMMNFTLLATPAEGLSGRFVRIDKNRFGVIDGITDKDYYTNSFHIPVGFEISALEKMRIEAPYHELCNAGHISYVEVDGDPLNNLEAFEKLVRVAHDLNMGYFAINHPIDTDPVCGYTGVIGDVCPICGRKEGEAVPIERLRELAEKYTCVKNHLRNCCL